MTLVMADGRARKTGFPGWSTKDGSPAALFFVRHTIPLFLQGRVFTGNMETEAMVFESMQIGGV